MKILTQHKQNIYKLPSEVNSVIRTVDNFSFSPYTPNVHVFFF
jgi:hypothetical protein